MNTERIKTQYLGDGVYANVGNYNGEIILSTDHHVSDDGPVPSNLIYLDPPTARALHLYLKDIFETPTT